MFIPEISLNTDKKQLVDALRQACKSHGFFYLVDHGIAINEIETLLRNMQVFFNQPQPKKQELMRSATNPWGYYDKELTKNRKDWKEILDIGPEADGTAEHPFPRAKTQWPKKMQGFQPLVQSYMNHCAAICEQLRVLLIQSLGSTNADQDAPFSKDHSSFLRLNHYPLCANPAPEDSDFVPVHGELGISHHTDAGALTLLLQSDVAGLQFYHQEQWHTIQPKAGALMVNIGDVVQVWSNDQYSAPLHRVIASATQQRYSAAYFYNPSYSDHYAPIPSTGEPVYKSISWAEFRSGRTAGDYADSGEELQISHYKL